MKDETCYGWDALQKVVIRFVSTYQRNLWIDNGHPEFPEDRQTLDATHNLVRRVKTWTYDQGRGFDIGTP
jgi:hypothetical protein